MNAAEFRKIAMSFPDVVESSHMGHPDFRVSGRIFATLSAPKPGFGMASLAPAQQAEFLQLDPGVYTPASGAWGEGGATIIKLSAARTGDVRRALELAWKRRAKKA
ncbi:MAG: MmcQ/YjbR family DNA-binding protein [Planctomycetes bacterium]|nr:MmcQ/YjbR family DNA-binding protein [Planctomycetota bacterium]